MPKINFRDLVSDILVEQQPLDATAAPANTAETGTTALPPWFIDILKEFDRIQGSDYAVTNNETKLKEIFQKAAKQRLSVPDVKAVGLPYAFILELLHTLWVSMPDHTSNVKTWETFVSKLNEKKLISKLISKGDTIKNQWKEVQEGAQLNASNIGNADIKNIYEAVMKEVASLGEKALQGDSELSNSSVIDAVQKIVNRRIGVFTRIAKLKNPKQPFTNLITDIFKTPELYLTGSKKYSSDFAAIDQLYIQDLIKIAIAAKEFYAAEVTRLKTQTPNSNNKTSNEDDLVSNMQQGQVDQATTTDDGWEVVASSLNLYDKFVNSILTEMPVSSYTTSTGAFDQSKYNTWFDQKLKQAGQEPESERVKQLAQQQPEQQSKGINPSVIKQLKDKALQDVPNRMNFLTGIPVQYIVVDENGKDTDQKGVIDSSKEYNVGGILKMQTPEAQNLIQALGLIAQYTKKRPGAGEIAGKAVGALGALSTGMGPVN
jgi:hypothetical protein